ncbi:MAG: phosphotransferase, partial [Deltaproteobacteria bacterium]|nr:phosphotransferase [Deltaproteobacteria bacterium]
MEQQKIPVSIEEISPEWLTGALTKSGVMTQGNSVRNVDYQIIGEGQGFVGTLARLNIEYDQQVNSLPATMIAKVPTPVKKSKMIMEAFWNYERENRIYEEILPELPLRTPVCYFSDFDSGKGEKWMNKVYKRYGSLSQGLAGLYFVNAGLRNVGMKKRYILLLEDLSDLEQVSHLSGCSFEEAKLVMKPLGVAHAGLWEKPELKKFWLKDHADMSNMMGFLTSRWEPIMKNTAAGKLTPKMKSVFDWINSNNRKLDKYSKSLPHTLVHTDFRLDNIFFNRKEKSVVVIDWQSPCPGFGLFDPAYFLMNNCSMPLDEGQIRELIMVYHQGLIEGGVSNYSLEQCLSDFPVGLLLAVRYWLIIVGG